MQFGCHFSKNIEKAQEQARLNKIVDIFRAGGTEIDVVPVIDVFRWKKTIWYAVSCLHCNLIHIHV